ncbi:MAG: hypothetical protein C0404_08400 [Verrucomicrobia bacterium]|nr:hypothetical protein [Verrucomicrobiota bacterium]
MVISNERAEEVIELVLAGERDAYREIVTAYYDDLMMRVCYRTSDANMAEDVVQNTFVRAYNQLARYEMGRDFGVWLRSIAHFLLLAELKKGYRARKNEEKYLAHIRESLLADASDEAEDLADVKTAMEKCVRELPEHTRSLILERYKNGRSVKDLAALFSRKVTWVTTSLYRVHRSLRSCIEQRIASEGT